MPWEGHLSCKAGIEDMGPRQVLVVKWESRVVPTVMERSLGRTSAEGFNRLASEVTVGTTRSFKSKSSQCHWQLQNQVIRKWSGEPSCHWSGQTGQIAKEEGHLCSQPGVAGEARDT